MVEKKIYIENGKFNKFYKKIYLYRFMKLFNIKFIVIYQNKEYRCDNNKTPKELQMILNIVNVLNSTSRKEKYDLIYDYACEFLDSEFKIKNHCDFKKDMCVCNRLKKNIKKVGSCCQSLKTNKICKHFDNINKCCRIKSLGCKLFVCPFLKRKGVKYRVNDVPYLKYFLSPRQKAISITSIFTDKDVVVDKYLKFYKIP